MKIKISELEELFSVIEEENLSISQAIERIKGDGNSKIEEQSKSVEESITLIVDYSQTVEQMIDAGQYDWANDDITENNFPLPTELSGKKISVSVKLFHFNRDISSKDAISEMDKAGYRPAILPELLVLSEVQPNLQRQFPIIALGSVWHDAYGDRYVPLLRVGSSGRKLDLNWFDGDWSGNYRFLAVCK